jgi:hypothetical protein
MVFGVGHSGKASKMRWTPEEDKLLCESIRSHGTVNWTLVASSLPYRTGKQCRERWVNQLSPQLKSEEWTAEEDCLLITLSARHGHQWSMIAQSLQGRSVNATKNRFGYLMRHGTAVPPIDIQRSHFSRGTGSDSTGAMEFHGCDIDFEIDAVTGKLKLPPISVLPVGPIRSPFDWPGIPS